jgi:hypothetical protein
MRGFAEMRTMDLWYTRLEVDDLVERWSRAATSKQVRRLERNLARTKAKDSMRAMDKLTHVVDGELRIASDPPLIVPIEEVAEGAEREQIEAFMQGLIRSYRRTLSGDRRRLLSRFRYVHAARKVVGVGSVGTRAWIVLLLGRDGQDPLLLQAKEAQASVLEPFLSTSAFANHGQRVVEGQRLSQAASDVMLGWIRIPGVDGVKRDFYLRQLWDSKGSAIVEAMEPGAMESYARVCGWTLAHAHARSGDPVAIAGYLGSGRAFDRALAEFAEKYADQNERDYGALADAVASGRIVAQTGL